MSKHLAWISWRRTGDGFSYQSYSRDHTWSFDGGIQVHASASPVYLGTAQGVDPEEAFVASLASCHMLTFLAMASRRGLTVDSYHDPAEGLLARNQDGQLAMTRVILQPEVRFDPAAAPSPKQLVELHEQAHHECFMANSVRTEVLVRPSSPGTP